jgi:hypothetical protein
MSISTATYRDRSKCAYIFCGEHESDPADWWKKGDSIRYVGPALEPTPQRKSKLQEEFNKLCEKWKKETYFHSSLGKLFTHPAYVRIIGMGKDAIPFVLNDLEKNPTRWFYALKYMAGFDAAAGATNFEEARMKWLEWGYQNNYL